MQSSTANHHSQLQPKVQGCSKRRGSECIRKVKKVKEEVGLNFDGYFLSYFDEIIPERYIHAVVMVFVGKAEGAPILNSTEVAEVRWFSLEEARALLLAFRHNEILDAYAARVPTLA